MRPQSPGVTWASSLPPRGSGGGPAWLTATELQDREDVLLACIMNTERGVLCYNVYKTAKEKQMELDLNILMVGNIVVTLYNIDKSGGTKPRKII